MSLEHQHPVPPPLSATPMQIVAYLEEVREHTMRWWAKVYDLGDCIELSTANRLKINVDDCTIECGASGLQIKFPSGVSDGDLFYYSDGCLERIAIGLEGATLQVSSGVPAWVGGSTVGDGSLDFSDSDNSHHVGTVA